MQMGVYETFEAIYGRKSTLDELIADVSQFTQKSMLWVCGTIVVGMQLWNRVDTQPGDVFSTLVQLYFDPPLRGRMLAGYWSSNPRHVLFHRRQILLIAKLAIGLPDVLYQWIVSVAQLPVWIDNRRRGCGEVGSA
jgi:hypothetical protein